MILTIPLIKDDFSIGCLEANNEAFSSWSIDKRHLFPSNNASNDLFSGIVWRTPFNLCWFSLHNKWILNSVTLLIRDSQKLVLWASYKQAFGMPVTMCHFFAMLWDAWNFSLAFSVIEHKWSLFRSNAENWMSVWPSNIRSLIFIGCKFNILELS